MSKVLCLEPCDAEPHLFSYTEHRVIRLGVRAVLDVEAFPRLVIVRQIYEQVVESKGKRRKIKEI